MAANRRVKSSESLLSEDNPQWYKDAIIYEVHVRAFCDGNGDGIGDFRGLTEKLDYLQDLGVTALWLLPFYPSPLRDDGYDIADYTDIHPSYGTLERFQAFPRARPTRAASGSSPSWCSTTRRTNTRGSSARGAPHPAASARDFYVWSDTPGEIPGSAHHLQRLRDFELDLGSRGQGLLLASLLFATNPISNFDNPAVLAKRSCGLRFLVEHGGGWHAPGRGAVSVRARGNQLRESRRNPRVL